MSHIISTRSWVSLSNEQRARIRGIFNIPRSSHVVVNDGHVETDGTTPKDLESLTTEKMKDYLKSDLDDFFKLFDLVVARVQDDIEGKPFIETVIVSEEPLTVVIPPKKRGRPSLKK